MRVFWTCKTAYMFGDLMHIQKRHAKFGWKILWKTPHLLYLWCKKRLLRN